MIRTLLLFSFLAIGARASAVEIPNRPGGPSWPSGVGSIAAISGYEQWASWMGYQPDLVTIWIPTVPLTTWSHIPQSISSSTYNYYLTDAMKMLPASVPIVISMPMVPNGPTIRNRACANPAVWDQFARGDFDSYWLAWANALKTKAQSHGRNPANHIIRLGWEMNGDWYPWSICNKVNEFKKSWEKVASIARGVIPGLMFDFSPAGLYVGFTAGRNYGGPHTTHPGVNLEGLLPHRDSYDVISLSVHDNGPVIVDEETWNEHYKPEAYVREIGLSELAATARKLGKQIALSEWSINYLENCDASKIPSPKPSFVLTKVYEFLQANASIVAWDTYFSPNCAALYPTAKQSSAAATTYKTLWTKNVPAPSPPRPPQLLTVE